MANTKFGMRIRQLRKKARLNQKEFCALLNIPQPTLSAYETDKMQPTVSTLIKVAETFNVSLDWLCNIKLNCAKNETHETLTLRQAIDALYDAADNEDLVIEITIKNRKRDG